MATQFTKTRKITIYYFSGTGNTQIISRRIAEKFTSQGFQTALKRMEETDTVSIGNDEIVGIGFPIACFASYPVVLDFIKKLPSVESVPAFGFCTMGGASFFGIIDELRSILLHNGYLPIGFREFQMPANIFVKLPESMRKREIADGFRNADQFVQAMLDGTAKWKKKLIGSKIIFLLAAGLFKLAELKIHQKLLKIRIDQSKCTRCGICVKKCPTKNISLNENIVIGDKCQYCFRCVAVCPHEATCAVLTPRSLHYRAEGSDL